MTPHNPLKAGAYMMGAVVSFTSMAVAGREMAHELDTFEIMTYRSFIGIAIVLLVAGLAGTLGQVTRRHMGLHIVRNASHFLGQNLWFYALTLITLPQLFAFEFSVPLWVALLAPFILNERLTRTRALAAGLGFAGILIVARPDQLGLSIGFMAAAISALGFTGSAIATKLLTRSETTTCILFWLTVLQAIFGVICAGYDGDIAWPSVASWPWVVLVGFAGLLAHFCITSALQIAPAVIVFPFDFLRLPLATAVGILFYAESFQMSVILGSAIIIGANVINLRAESKPA